MKKSKITWQNFAAISLISFACANAHAAYLPTVGDGSGAYYSTATDALGVTRDVIMLDGVTIAFKHDSFWSYSATLLTSMQDQGTLSNSYGSFDFSTGLGTLDVVFYTQANGADNDPVGPGNAFTFEDPIPTPAGNATYAEGTWGLGDQDNGPVLVGDMENYLKSFTPPTTVPVFYVDWVQPGSNSSLLANFYAEIYDPTTQTTVKRWSLDGIDNGAWDPLSQVLNIGEACSIGTSGKEYCIDGNTGSGKADFIFYAPDMDLSQYNDDDYFVLHGTLGCASGVGLDGKNGGLGCLAGGGEEAFLTGSLVPQTNVPEPGTLLLIGASLFGLGATRRRTHKTN